MTRLATDLDKKSVRIMRYNLPAANLSSESDYLRWHWPMFSCARSHATLRIGVPLNDMPLQIHINFRRRFPVSEELCSPQVA